MESLTAHQEFRFSLEDGTQLVYRFDDLPLIAAKSAEAVYVFYADLAKRPAPSLQQFLALGCNEIGIQALSYIVRVEKNGVLEEYNHETTPKAMLKLLRTLPVSASAQVEAVLEHFFERMNYGTLLFLVHRRHELDVAALYAETELRVATAMTESKNLFRKENADLQTSTALSNSDEDSPKSESTTSSTDSPEATSLE